MDSSLIEKLSWDTKASKVVSGANASRAALWFLFGPLRKNEQLRHVPIGGGPFTIGRCSDVDFCIPDETVSSVHAELVVHNDALIINDLGSTNGTYVNAARITGSAEVRPGDLIQFADVPFRVLHQSPLENSATVSHDVVEEAMALVHFETLMATEAVVPHYQPIVDIAGQQTIGYEVLGRSRFPGLETPASMFSVASQMNLEVKLSQMLRAQGVQQSRGREFISHLFVNTHPAELAAPGLIESMAAIRQINTGQRLTLEIHEAAVTNIDDMKKLRETLRDWGIGLAFDDFGAGQTRLAELFKVQPDYLKFDMSLIRSIHESSVEHQKMIRGLVSMVRDIGVTPLAEGIEQEQEALACKDLGFQLAQGYFFGRPSRALLGEYGGADQL